MARDFIEAAAEAHTNLNILASVVTVLEGGHICGGKERTHRAVQKIIKICEQEQQWLLRDYDRSVARAKAPTPSPDTTGAKHG